MTQPNVHSPTEFDQITINGVRVYVGDTEPTDAEQGDVWIDTS